MPHTFDIAKGTGVSRELLPAERVGIVLLYAAVIKFFAGLLAVVLMIAVQFVIELPVWSEYVAAVLSGLTLGVLAGSLLRSSAWERFGTRVALWGTVAIGLANVAWAIVLVWQGATFYAAIANAGEILSAAGFAIGWLDGIRPPVPSRGRAPKFGGQQSQRPSSF